MDTSTDRSDSLELALRQGERSIDEQSRSLEALRTRASLVLAAAGVAAGLLGGPVFERSRHLSDAGWVMLIGAGVAFATVALMTIGVWKPLDVRFNVDPGVLLSGYIDADPPASTDEMRHWLAYWRALNIDGNAEALDRRVRYFVVSLHAFPVMVMTLLLVLADAVR